MGIMKEFDIRIRGGGDDAIAAVSELLRWNRLPGFVPNVECTRDRNGRVTTHWPDEATSTTIARELLDDMVDRVNDRLWIPVSDSLPDPDVNHGYVLVSRRGVVTTANYFGAFRNWWHVHDRDDETTPPEFWMPMPEPPEAS